MAARRWAVLSAACCAALLTSACMAAEPDARTSPTPEHSPSSLSLGRPTAPSPTPSASRPPAQWSDFDPANFHHPPDITNAYFPVTPGTRSRWEGHAYDDGEKVSRVIEWDVTSLTKEIAGVETVVAMERDFTDGEAEEVELTFYAQDDFGTVWYFGEYSEEYEDAKIVKSPLWLAGPAGRPGWGHDAGDSQDRHPGLCRGIGTGRALERSGQGEAGRRPAVRPDRLLPRRGGHRGVQRR